MKATGTLLVAIALLASVLVVLFAVELSVPLERLRQPLADALSAASERKVDIEGELSLTLSKSPALLVRDLHIYNEPGWQSDTIASLNEVRFEVALLPLLKGEFILQELSARNAAINLEQNTAGRRNWMVSGKHADHAPTESSPKNNKAPENHRFFTKGIFFDRIRLSNISLNYLDGTGPMKLSDHIDRLEIDMQDRSYLEATVVGTLNDSPYTFTANSDLLRKFGDNKPWRLDIQGEIAEVPISLKADLHIANEKLRGQVSLQTGNLKAGRLLEQLGIVSGLDFYVQQVQMRADIEGGSLQELIDRSSLSVNLDNGQLKLLSHVDQRFRNITFDSALLSASTGQELKLEFDGLVGKDPMQFSMLTNPLTDFISGLDTIRLGISANYLQNQIELKGSVRLPVSSKTLAMNISLSGANLAQWNSVLHNDLPPIGPYQLSGRLLLTPEGYQVEDFRSTIASSELRGNLKIDMSDDRAVWVMNLDSERLQLNDFDVEGYTLIPGKESALTADTKETELSAKDRQRQLSMKVDQRMGETRDIDRWDIDLLVDSQNIYSGDDRLGGGRIIISAREGSLELSTELNIPGGQIAGDSSLRLVNNGIEGHVRLDMDRFDYGILLRRMDPDSLTDGLISARVDLQLAGESFSRRFDRANGHFDFAVWPDNTGAGDIDIWAANIFQAASSSVTNPDSRLNCAVGVLNIEDGQLSEEFLGVDTTKVWLFGDLEIDFSAQTIELNLVPRAKKPKIAGIETPVHLKGKLTDKFDSSDLKVENQDVANTLMSIFFSPLHAPLRRIFGHKIPEDNSEKCGELFDREKLQPILTNKRATDYTYEEMFPGN